MPSEVQARLSCSLSLFLLLNSHRHRYRAPHPANLQFTGTIPANVDAHEAHRQHVRDKHR